MAEPKTKPTAVNPQDFIEALESKEKKADGLHLLKLFQKITGEKPVMWGESIIGFGKYHYQSERSSQKGDWPLVGFSPRKQNLTLYIMAGNSENFALLEKLGKHKTSVGCLYLKRLSDVDEAVLSQLIQGSYEYMKKKHKVS